MDKQHSFWAFLATLGTMAYVITVAAWLAYHGKYAEALGIGGLLTALVSVATLLARPNSPQGNTQADANLAALLDKVPSAGTAGAQS
jgi:Zn-dependent protease with chaperone function